MKICGQFMAIRVHNKNNRYALSLFSLKHKFPQITRETCSPLEPLGRWPVGEEQGAKGNFHK